MPTHDPGLVKHMPKLRPQVQATLGKALRWFNDALTWREPEVLRQPTPAQLREWLTHDGPLWCYDYETEGINLFDLNVNCLAIATPDVDKHGRMTMPWEVPAQVARVVGINILGGDGRRRFYTPSDEADIKDILREFFLDPARLKIGHNAGYFDRQVTELWLGVVPHPVKDTLFDARFMYPDLPKGLKPTGRRMTDVHKWETNESGEKGHGSKVIAADLNTQAKTIDCRDCTAARRKPATAGVSMSRSARSSRPGPPPGSRATTATRPPKQPSTTPTGCSCSGRNRNRSR